MHPGVVLVVGTEPSTRALVAAQLRDRGYGVFEAHETAAAVDRLGRSLVDIVVADLREGSIDGTALIGAGAFLVALVSQYDLSWIDAGATDELTLPFDPHVLAAKAASAVRIARLSAQLKERNRELLAFTRRAGHDLKTPLTVVMGMAQTLAARWPGLSDDERAHYLQTIVGAADKAANMITDLVTLGRAGADADDEPDATVDTEEVARRVVTAHDLEPDAVLRGEWAATNISEASLSRILVAFVENAVFYGDGESLSLTASPAPDGLHIVVEDSGDGLPPELGESAFDPFVRGKGAADKHPAGSGVGLALARRTARQWGATVVLDPTDPEKDTTARFRIVLPFPPAAFQHSGIRSLEFT